MEAPSVCTPLHGHVGRGAFSDVYEPAEDTFLLLDALEAAVAELTRCEEARVPAGQGSGVLKAAAQSQGKDCRRRPFWRRDHPPRQRLAPGSQTEWQVRRGPVGARAPTEPRGVISRHTAMTSARAPGSSNQTARSAPNAPRHCFLGQTVTPEARGVTGLTDEDEMLEWGVSLK